MFIVSEFTKDLNTFCEKYNYEWGFNTDKQIYEIAYKFSRDKFEV